ncbi:cyclase family protein [Alicyclobacillus acidoterrestris]|uniref:Kynurenine formamidase n=1 Tax=Alicyclobacillus acidoterrestris (strain ATCC 49025 / DSM 3922 / CIP 106132 / NCIMB 13137 / GD3B) TaxID=1356854 RepID=T0BS67_ALIAG|nr:cyclase family protein [Alicyclobacillus acidoterrestris]EPZ43355.1 cyclase [Alicyclobacillus acidoterrestris ATCC 49025]UNO48789.1 cyclase family protein [Alicyclobacillus acidoterrestris]GEO26667.1 cyclase [Alicyclobacillus acidoterrestris]
MARTIYDVSMLIHEGVQVYKNKDEKRPRFETTSDFSTGSSHETRIHLDAHTGTHIDAPLHMIPDGKTIETVKLKQLVGNCRVLDLTDVEGGIGRADLEPHKPQPGEFLLFKTKNSWDEEFNYEFIYLAQDGAEYLADIGITGVGIDGLGVERAQPGHETHTALLSKDIVIIEGLRLKNVPAGEYFMVAAPLKLTGIDAAPARVMLFEGVGFLD